MKSRLQRQTRRPLILLALVGCVFAMHALGLGHGTSMRSSVVAASDVRMSGVMDAMVAGPNEIATDAVGMEAPVAMSAVGDRMTHDSAMCLAVLAGAGVLLLFYALLRRRTRPCLGWRRLLSLPPAARGRRHPLSLVGLCVSRT